jgi:hypothetical protein
MMYNATSGTSDIKPHLSSTTINLAKTVAAPGIELCTSPLPLCITEESKPC